MSIYNLNYKFQNKDDRDHVFITQIDEFKKHELSSITIPSKNAITVNKSKVSLNSFIIPKLAPILDQGDLGSCVCNAFSYCINTQTSNNVVISRLFLYAICRSLDYTSLDQDDGTTIRTACKSIQKYGAVSEKNYPYITSIFNDLPPLSVFKSSNYFKKFTYTFVNQDITSIKNCLNTYKVPIVFGFLVYDSFMNISVANTGNVSIPDIKTEKLQGGHCMNIVGYNDETSTFKCANSWGTSWGDKGYCYLPYDYLLNTTLASDFCFSQFIY
jgi:C1A family cysteine protease